MVICHILNSKGSIVSHILIQVMVTLSVFFPHYPYAFSVGSKVGGPSCLELNGCSATCMEPLLVNNCGKTSVLSHHFKFLAASILETTVSER